MRSPNRRVGVIVGGAFLLFGLLGLLLAPGVGFFAAHGGELFGVFEVNPAQNILHVLFGAALAIAGLSGVRASETVNSAAGGLLLVLGLVGLFLVGSELNVLALNVADNVLHFGAAALLLAVGLGADKQRADPREAA